MAARFCSYTETAGIKPWFRKRAMQIAAKFKTDDACKDIPLLDALGIGQKEPIAAPVSADGVSPQHSTARTADTATATALGLPDPKADATSRGTPRWMTAKTENCDDLTGCEIEAGTRFLEAVQGNRDRAVHIIDVLCEAVAEVLP